MYIDCDQQERSYRVKGEISRHTKGPSWTGGTPFLGGVNASRWDRGDVRRDA